MSEQTQTTALDEIKAIESQARKLSLLEIITDLRMREKEIKTHKAYTRLILKELGYSEKDIKAIIDYISQEEVDEKEILEDVRDDLKEKKQKAEKKIKDSPYINTVWQSPRTFQTNNLGFSTTTNAMNAVSSLQQATPTDFNFVSGLAQ